MTAGDYPVQSGAVGDAAEDCDTQRQLCEVPCMGSLLCTALCSHQYDECMQSACPCGALDSGVCAACQPVEPPVLTVPPAPTTPPIQPTPPTSVPPAQSPPVTGTSYGAMLVGGGLGFVVVGGALMLLGVRSLTSSFAGLGGLIVGAVIGNAVATPKGT